MSDAGAPFHYEAAQGRDWFRQSLRALDIATNQARGMRKRVLVDLYKTKQPAPSGWPYPAHALDKPLPQDVKVESTRDLLETSEAP